MNLHRLENSFFFSFLEKRHVYRRVFKFSVEKNLVKILEIILISFFLHPPTVKD